ncbi:hypothetical protein K788_00023980 [Paraburkholderia caribensis MBA4]|uniref:Uncharacterized protein n=1 Tax=Paraburkholderia caribensis MBA4 TaxID=1323664 RepID=A0A0P0RK18_9BURK|nr:hypothetical protein K788_00023980 [Paraburkholderia caribensis MBA4]
MEAKHQLASAHARLRVTDGLPCAAVPHDDAAGAVLLLRNRPLELRILDGMVFHVDGHAFFLRVIARALGYGPRQQHAFMLQPEVVVQPAGPVLLYDEAQILAGRQIRRRGCRFRRDQKVPLFAVAGKRRRCGIAVRDHEDGLRKGYTLRRKEDARGRQSKFHRLRACTLLR